MDQLILDAALASYHEDAGVREYLRRRPPSVNRKLRKALLKHFSEAVVDSNGKIT